MGDSHRLGEWGENTARVFLELCGYRCLDRRYRRPGGEIDLVMTRADVLVFVEVKTRGPGAIADPEAWLSRFQLQRMRKLAARWLHENRSQTRGVPRFDLVSVHYHGQNEGAEIRHLAGVG